MHTTMSRADLKGLLLDMPQPCFRNGEAYEIKSKHLGAGVYRVWLERWKPTSLKGK
jgi:hypothetical protein